MAKSNNNNDLNNKKHNVFASGTRIVGSINSDGGIRIDGEIEGDIVTKGRLVLGKSGIVNGTIVCPNAEILGQFEGSIKVEDTLAIRDTAKVTGEVITTKLTIDVNAVFNGSCNMNTQSDNKLNVKTTEKAKS